MSTVRRIYREEEGGGEKGGGGGEADAALKERATRMGWADKPDFKGAPDKWVDAKTYVENGEQSLPILRERMRTMERSLADSTKANKDYREFAEKAEERAYKRAKTELEAKVKQTAKAGDDEGAAAAATELVELERDHATATAASKDKPDPEFDAWVKQHGWYDEKSAAFDADLALEAEAEAFKLRKKGDKREGTVFLDAVADAVKKRFPDRFVNPRRKNGSGVENAGGDAGSGGGGGGSKKGWDSLPPQAKKDGERFIKQGLVKDKATYAEQYHAQDD